jgi:hypothetical protein
MIVVIDRITDGVAVLELPSLERLEIPASRLPAHAKEGDCLNMDTNGGLSLNTEETARRKKANAELFKKLSGGSVQ